jgi:hypothetical protein
MSAPSWDALEKLLEVYDPRRLRSVWLTDLRQLSAEWLRTPAFLALAKFNLSFLGRRTTPAPPRAP